MSVSEYSDYFVVVNGPEDGTEFPIMRAPLSIGQEPDCAVNIRLDTSVRKQHAHVSVVPDGYRIRRADAAPVYVDGKRAGVVRSRIVRAGGTVQVGRTLLCLECAPDGLASRSRGMVMENDLLYAARQVFLGLFQLASGFLQFTRRVFGRILGSWVAIGTIVIAVLILFPGLRSTVFYQARNLYAWALYYVQTAQ